MGDLTERKLQILEAIVAVQDERTLSALEDALAKATQQEVLLKKLTKPMRKTTDIEQIIKEQNWKPVDMEEWRRLVKELDIQESAEDLVKMLTK